MCLCHCNDILIRTQSNSIRCYELNERMKKLKQQSIGIDQQNSKQRMRQIDTHSLFSCYIKHMRIRITNECNSCNLFGTENKQSLAQNSFSSLSSFREHSTLQRLFRSYTLNAQFSEFFNYSNSYANQYFYKLDFVEEIENHH